MVVYLIVVRPYWEWQLQWLEVAVHLLQWCIYVCALALLDQGTLAVSWVMTGGTAELRSGEETSRGCRMGLRLDACMTQNIQNVYQHVSEYFYVQGPTSLTDIPKQALPR